MAYDYHGAVPSNITPSKYVLMEVILTIGLLL